MYDCLPPHVQFALALVDQRDDRDRAVWGDLPHAPPQRRPATARLVSMQADLLKEVLGQK